MARATNTDRTRIAKLPKKCAQTGGFHRSSIGTLFVPRAAAHETFAHKARTCALIRALLTS